MKLTHEGVVTVAVFLGVAAITLAIMTQGDHPMRVLLLSLFVLYWVHYSTELNWYTAQWNDWRPRKAPRSGNEPFLTASYTQERWDALSEEEQASVMGYNWRKYCEHRTPDEISEEVHHEVR